jgi:hypothetical protein
MTGDEGNLTLYFPLLSHNSSQIVLGNGSRLPILGTGSTHIRAPHINFILVVILHTPSPVSNLISIQKFTKDNWSSIEFDPFGFFVKGLISKTTILRSNSFGELYPFVGSTTSTNKFALSASVSSVDLWHRQLRHPSAAFLSNLLSIFPIPCTNKSVSPSVCEACQKGKHIRLPFHNSQAFTYFPFQLILCDIWTSLLRVLPALNTI